LTYELEQLTRQQDSLELNIQKKIRVKVIREVKVQVLAGVGAAKKASLDGFM